MTPREFDLWLRDPRRTPLVMGVLNITPDSFSDGGKFETVEAAVEHARAMVAAGASIIDVGGESTRPGAGRLPADEQIRRVVPVIEKIADLGALVSIDTTRAMVAEAALGAGAAIVNDISAVRDDPGLLALVAQRGAPLILMHMQGTPGTMQDKPAYQDVVSEVIAFLREQTAAARSAGVEEARILIDPGIGFGKTVGHNLELLRRQRELLSLGRPLVIGTSRKTFIGKITGQADAEKRLFGTAATVAWSIANGAAIVRVHDVGPMSEVVAMIRAINTD